MEKREKTPYFDKNEKRIYVGDLVYYSEMPDRYADSMNLIIKKDGKFCQASIAYNKSACEEYE